jgi:hypothetical protein
MTNHSIINILYTNFSPYITMRSYLAYYADN